jgi:hypothetical protein
MAVTRKPPRKGTGEFKLSVKLDPETIEQIQRCLKKGKLTVTVSKVQAVGRMARAYLWD